MRKKNTFSYVKKDMFLKGNKNNTYSFTGSYELFEINLRVCIYTFTI